MALVGNMINMALGGNPSIVNYVMFVAVISMLSVIYQVLALHNEAFQIMPIVPLVVDALNTLFFLVGGIALAAYLGVHTCFDSVSSRDTRLGGGSLTRVRADVYGYQYRNIRLVEQPEALSGGAGRHGVPVVRLRRLARLARPHRHERVRLQRQPAWGHRRYPPRRRAQYVPGLMTVVWRFQVRELALLPPPHFGKAGGSGEIGEVEGGQAQQ